MAPHVASLQIPFLLNVASEFTRYIISFPPSAAATFSILRKLDHVFASLLSGRDAETNEDLPGFENGLRCGMTTTDMVRCKGIVEQTRVVIVDVMTQEPEDLAHDEVVSDMDGGDISTADESEAGNENEAEDELFMDVARVYEKTIVQLGERLGHVLVPLGSGVARQDGDVI